MDKLWKSIEMKSGPSVSEEIIKEIFFSDARRLEDIRESFNKWGTQDLTNLMEEFMYSPTADEGASVEYEFGEYEPTSFHPHREVLIMHTVPDVVWGICSKKKKFF